eukprot:TRINITY_DN10090_c0_g1_i1.p1 TRINITY_DN10090_c0_g1~~TRINITY_DN10090_c0_g1_i1.p1  ORF type:complete len:277 (-),score=30.58 TRINITY_DN10090_c0_g1_i1:1350-2180(-)
MPFMLLEPFCLMLLLFDQEADARWQDSGLAVKARLTRTLQMEQQYSGGSWAQLELMPGGCHMATKQNITGTNIRKDLVGDARAVPIPHLRVNAETTKKSEPRVPSRGRVGVNAIKQMVQKIAVAEAEAMVTQTSIRRGYAGRHPSVWRRLMAPWNNADLRRQQEYSAPLGSGFHVPRGMQTRRVAPSGCQCRTKYGRHRRHRQHAGLRRCHLLAPGRYAGFLEGIGNMQNLNGVIYIGIGNTQNFNGIIYLALGRCAGFLYGIGNTQVSNGVMHLH